MPRILLALICCVCGVACRSSPDSAAPPPSGFITHVVLVWMKDPSDAAARQRLTDAGESFRAIPGVRQVTVGNPVPSQRPGVDASFDLGFIMTFDNENALRAYQDHPLHVKAVRDILAPAVRQVKVYDLAAQ